MRSILSFIVGLPAGVLVAYLLGVPFVNYLGIEKMISTINVFLAIAIAYCSIRSIVRLMTTYPPSKSGYRQLDLSVCFFVPSFLLGIFFVFACKF